MKKIEVFFNDWIWHGWHFVDPAAKWINILSALAILTAFCPQHFVNSHLSWILYPKNITQIHSFFIKYILLTILIDSVSVDSSLYSMSFS